MRLRSFVERIRDSQFYLPALFILASLVLAAVARELDARDPDGASYLIPSSVQAGRVLLGTVAGAIITVAALVFSFTAVTVQLASSQYSPRVVQEFIRDRVQQLVVGVFMGTFTFCLVSLATVGGPSGVQTRADWAVTIGVALGVLSAIVIVGYIDHVTRRVRVDDTIQRLADRTREAFSRPVTATASVAGESWNLAPDSTSTALRSEHDGFVQEIDIDGLVAALDSGMVARLDVWTGSHVIEGMRLLTVWTAGAAHPPEDDFSRFIAVGDTRTIDQDPGLGVQQLVDIALRALSPGVNDPATAADVVIQLARCLRTSHLAGHPDRAFVGPNGARLLAPHSPTFGEVVSSALDPIRRVAGDQPVVLEAIIESLTAVLDEMDPDGADRAPLEAQVGLAREALERAGAA